MLRLVTIKESQIPEDDLDLASGVYAMRPLQHAAMEITYLAIDKKYQAQHLGTETLKMIIANIQRISEEIPIRYIVLDSLKAKIEFYEKRGFKTLGEPDIHSETQYMYMDCLRDRTDLEEYINQF